MLRIDRLLERAKDRGVTQSHLAELVGRQRYYVKDLARDGTQPSAETIAVWADALSTTPAYLLGETDEKEKPTGAVADGRLTRNLSWLRLSAGLVLRSRMHGCWF